MTATYSDLLRLTKQATGDNNNTWGSVVNSGVIELLEDSIAGTVSVDVTTSGGTTISLTSNNGATDEARNAIINISGLPAATGTVIEVPAVSKTYLVKCSLQDTNTITVSPAGGGTGVSFADGDTRYVYCDGTNIHTVNESTLSSMGVTASASEINVLEDRNNCLCR